MNTQKNKQTKSLKDSRKGQDILTLAQVLTGVPGSALVYLFELF